MYNNLLKLDQSNKFISVGVIGIGAMGAGICYQINITPGMKLSFIGDINIEAAIKVAEASNLKYRIINNKNDARNLKDDEVAISDNCNELFDYKDYFSCDVFVESTNSIIEGTNYCIKAIENNSHVVLMNAEIDLWSGRYLKQIAEKNNVIVTSDAGDQHGVLIRLYEEVKMLGLKPVQLGNIKGFLDRYATADILIEEAAKRNLNPIQCCSYTDGTKLNIEMAILSNATGMLPTKPGMEGPKIKHIDDAINVFDFSKYSENGHVDYVLGANPGGGVYIIAHNDSKFQKPYFNYYKLGEGPYYVIYRHYHLCHMETPYAIYKAQIEKKPLLSQSEGYLADVYAYAKKDLKPGDPVEHSIGGDEVYGLIEKTKKNRNSVPIGIMETEGKSKCKIKNNIKKDERISFDDIELGDNDLTKIFKQQFS